MADPARLLYLDLAMWPSMIFTLDHQSQSMASDIPEDSLPSK